MPHKAVASHKTCVFFVIVTKKTFIATAAVECIVKMTTTNSGLNITIVLVLLCLGIMFVGG